MKFWICLLAYDLIVFASLGIIESHGGIQNHWEMNGGFNPSVYESSLALVPKLVPVNNTANYIQNIAARWIGVLNNGAKFHFLFLGWEKAVPVCPFGLEQLVFGGDGYIRPTSSNLTSFVTGRNNIFNTQNSHDIGCNIQGDRRSIVFQGDHKIGLRKVLLKGEALKLNRLPNSYPRALTNNCVLPHLIQLPAHGGPLKYYEDQRNREYSTRGPSPPQSRALEGTHLLFNFLELLFGGWFCLSSPNWLGSLNWRHTLRGFSYLILGGIVFAHGGFSVTQKLLDWFQFL